MYSRYVGIASVFTQKLGLRAMMARGNISPLIKITMLITIAMIMLVVIGLANDMIVGYVEKMIKVEKYVNIVNIIMLAVDNVDRNNLGCLYILLTMCLKKPLSFLVIM